MQQKSIQITYEYAKELVDLDSPIKEEFLYGILYHTYRVYIKSTIYEVTVRVYPIDKSWAEFDYIEAFEINNN